MKYHEHICDYYQIDKPENLSELSLMTFFACSSLKTIVIPNGVTELGYWVFNSCPLKNIQNQLKL